MDPGIFRENAPGRLVPVVAGPPDARMAYVPDPLPPEWRWPEEMWPLLVEARATLARLDGTGRHLPNPELLLRPLARRESQLSSQLEGTVTDPQQQALFEAQPLYPLSEADPVNAFREVYNYGRALRLGQELGRELPLSLRLVRRLHEVLMEGVRGSDRSPGEFRRTQNQIGRPARFVPPPPLHLMDALDGFEKYLHVEGGYDPLVRAFLAHYQFETIHPFMDGNGRVGRLLLSLTICEWCKLSNQWLYMSAYFERNKDRYMELMLGVSTRGEWGEWVRFCLEGVVETAEDTLRRCDGLLRLHHEFHGRLRGGSVRLAGIVDELFVTPVVTAAGVRDRMGVTYPTARADLVKLARLGIVRELEGAAQVTYFCPPIYDITHGELRAD